MRRLIPVALSLLLAVPVAYAQINGVPPSVISLRPGQPFSSAPPASVTSLGPLGWQVPPGVTFVPGIGFQRRFVPRFPHGFNGHFGQPFNRCFSNGCFFNGQFFNGHFLNGRLIVNGDFDADDFFRFRRLGFFDGAPFLPSAVIPIVVPYENQIPVPVLVQGGQAMQAAATQPIEVHVTQQAAPTPAAVAAPVPPQPAPEQPATVLVFRDGHRLEIRNYAIFGNELLNFSGAGPRRIALGDLDVEATRKLNDDRGVQFRLPTTVRGS